MSCMPETVIFNDNGKHTYFNQTDCLLVIYWKNKYNAKEMVEWKAETGTSILHY